MQAFMTEFWSDFLNPDNIVGHVAYVLLIGSMMMRNINWLRVLAIGAGSISAIFYWTLGDFVSVFWESLFSLVNVIQLVIIFIENRVGKFTADEALFIKTVLPDVERAHARKLVRQGAWSQVGEGAVMISEESSPNQLQFIVEGSASVTRKGKFLGKVGKGDFLGEMSYLTGNDASATVISSEPVRYLALDRNLLKDHLGKNPEVRHALESSFNRNLIEKLVKTNAKVKGVAQ